MTQVGQRADDPGHIPSRYSPVPFPPPDLGNQAAAFPGELGVGSEGTGAELNRLEQPFGGNGPASRVDYEHIPIYSDAPDFKMVALAAGDDALLGWNLETLSTWRYCSVRGTASENSADRVPRDSGRRPKGTPRILC